MAEVWKAVERSKNIKIKNVLNFLIHQLRIAEILSMFVKSKEKTKAETENPPMLERQTRLRDYKKKSPEIVPELCRFACVEPQTILIGRKNQTSQSEAV